MARRFVGTRRQGYGRAALAAPVAFLLLCTALWLSKVRDGVVEGNYAVEWGTGDGGRAAEVERRKGGTETLGCKPGFTPRRLTKGNCLVYAPRTLAVAQRVGRPSEHEAVVAGGGERGCQHYRVHGHRAVVGWLESGEREV